MDKLKQSFSALQLRNATIRVPFYCGTTQKIVQHAVEREPKFWEAGTVVKVLEQLGADFFRVELPDGQVARLGRSRLKLNG